MNVTYKQGCDIVDWDQLTALYGEVGLVGRYGKQADALTVERVFRASTEVVTAWCDSRLIGAGRTLSDGMWNSAIFDVGVLPEFQKCGVGKGLMQHLMADLEHTRFFLTSTWGKEAFYSKLGFKRHKTAMALYPYPSDYLE